jgi:hypothetical protein
MPDLIQESTAAPNPPLPPDPPEPPATWDPTKPYLAPFPWEDHPVFRFTFLLWFTREGDRDALEVVGRLLYDMTLEVCGTWPQMPESTTRAEMRAVAKDLRHAQASSCRSHGRKTPPPWGWKTNGCPSWPRGGRTM